MKKWKLLLAAGILALACAGCGGQEAETEEQSDNFSTVDVQAVGVPTEKEIEEKNDNYETLEGKHDNGEVEEFAQKIQDAVAAKNMEALADLCLYPLAVNGEVIDNKEAFIALGSDVIFTEERCAVIEAVDVSALEETMAGIVMGDSTPNIIFNSVDDKLGITGIN